MIGGVLGKEWTLDASSDEQMRYTWSVSLNNTLMTKKVFAGSERFHNAMELVSPATVSGQVVQACSVLAKLRDEVEIRGQGRGALKMMGPGRR